MDILNMPELKRSIGVDKWIAAERTYPDKKVAIVEVHRVSVKEITVYYLRRVKSGERERCQSTIYLL